MQHGLTPPHPLLPSVPIHRTTIRDMNKLHTIVNTSANKSANDNYYHCTFNQQPVSCSLKMKVSDTNQTKMGGLTKEG